MFLFDITGSDDGDDNDDDQEAEDSDHDTDVVDEDDDVEDTDAQHLPIPRLGSKQPSIRRQATSLLSDKG